MITDPSKFVPCKWLVTLASGKCHVVEANNRRGAARIAAHRFGRDKVEQVRQATGAECEKAAQNFVRGCVQAVSR